MRETSNGDGQGRMTNRGRGQMPAGYDWEQVPAEYDWEPVPGGDDWGGMPDEDGWSQGQAAVADDWRQAAGGWTQGPARGNRGPVPGQGRPGAGPARGGRGTRAGGYEQGPPGAAPGGGRMAGRGGGQQGGGYGPGPQRGGYPRGPRGAGYETGPMPVGYDTGPMPAGYDSGPMPAGYDSGPMPAPFDSGPMPAAFDSGQVTAGFSRAPRTSGYERGPGAPGGGRGRTAAPAGRGPRTAGGPRTPAGGARGPARSGKAGKGSAKTGALIITVASLVAAFFVIFVLAYDSSAGNRSKAEQAAFVAPVTHLGTLASQYESIAQTANTQLEPDMKSYTANQGSNVAAARSALLAEIATGRTFDDSLANWITTWQQNYAAAQTVQKEASFPVNIPYPSSVAKTAQAVILADQAREAVLVQQVHAVTLRQLQSLNGQQQAAGVAIQAQDTLLRKALRLPPA